MNVEAVRKMLRRMSDDEFEAWLCKHVPEGIREELEADAELAGLLAQITPENRHALALYDDAERCVVAQHWVCRV